MPGLVSRLGALGLACGLAGCGGDAFTPTEDTVVGTYTASVFLLTTAGITTDLLALGASVIVTLAPDGTTSGRLFVPGAGENDQDLDRELIGTWTLNGNAVTFAQTTDPWIPEIEFTAGRDTLVGEGTFEEDRVRLELRRVQGATLGTGSGSP